MAEKNYQYIMRYIENDHEVRNEYVGLLVMCRDCEHHREKPIGFVNCVYHLTTVDDDGFCKWGERRTDAHMD